MEKTKIDYTLDSREVAEMIEKQHKNLIRDIKRYLADFSELNIEPAEFFRENVYKDEQGKDRPCYKITKNGCEFIAHKLTGVKGTAFTVKYIKRFHEMENMLNREQQLELPWFIHNLDGRYVILERDFIQITGVNIKKHKLFYREEYFTPGLDWNGHAWNPDRVKFKQKYGFDCGDEPSMLYFYPCGAIKALEILKNDVSVKLIDDAYNTIINGIAKAYKICRRGNALRTTHLNDNRKNSVMVENSHLPIKVQITIMSGDEIITKVAPVQQKE